MNESVTESESVPFGFRIDVSGSSRMIMLFEPERADEDE
jgi:hypothetical protein